MRGEYESDHFDNLPLFQSGPAWAVPLSSPANDPATAIAASQDENVREHVRRGTARCLLTLTQFPEGLTDDEAVDSYRLLYPDEYRARGIVGFVRSVLRNWCLLKPNDDTRNRLQRNLNLIHRTADERVNLYSGKKNVVFNFIQRPTDSQLAEWGRLANEEENDECDSSEECQ
jgi:hypothetical protein